MSNDTYALFLDRDGTLIEDKGYLSQPDGVHLLPGVKSCLEYLHIQGWLFFLFSNQSGVGRGYFPLEDVQACNQRMLQHIGLGPNLFTRTCCPVSTPESPCPYRKPSPKFILECLYAFSLNPDRCWMIGDKDSDIQAGQSAHIHTIRLAAMPHPDTVCCKDFYEVKAFLTHQVGGY